MTRYLTSVLTPNYIQQARNYFCSLPLIRSCAVRVILLDFTEKTDPEGQIERTLRQTMPWVEFRKLPLPESHSNFMIQHGVFLDALPEVNREDIVVLSDMDIILQRDFYPEEWAALEPLLDDNTVAAYWNAGPTDTLDAEAERIGLLKSWADTFAPPEGLQSIPCMNCGVLIAQAGVFRRMQRCYEWHCDCFYEEAQHRSRCQFLLNWCWWKLGLRVVVLPEQIHAHGHFHDGVKPIVAEGTEFRLGVVCNSGTPIIFRHAM